MGGSMAGAASLARRWRNRASVESWGRGPAPGVPLC